MDKNRDKRDGRERKSSPYEERVIEIARVSRVVKGGRRIRFRILVVIGDQNGKIGYGMAKATEIAVGVKKAVTQAEKRMISIPVVNDTVPYQTFTEFGSAKILLKPAKEGTSIVAGGVVRIIAELAGIKNMVAKVYGTSNKVNNVKAMFKALSSFEPTKVEQVRKASAKSQVNETPSAPQNDEKSEEAKLAEKSEKIDAPKTVKKAEKKSKTK